MRILSTFRLMSVLCPVYNEQTTFDPRKPEALQLVSARKSRTHDTIEATIAAHCHLCDGYHNVMCVDVSSEAIRDGGRRPNADDYQILREAQRNPIGRGADRAREIEQQVQQALQANAQVGAAIPPAEQAAPRVGRVVLNWLPEPGHHAYPADNIVVYNDAIQDPQHWAILPDNPVPVANPVPQADLGEDEAF